MFTVLASVNFDHEMAILSLLGIGGTNDTATVVFFKMMVSINKEKQGFPSRNKTGFIRMFYSFHGTGIVLKCHGPTAISLDVKP